ncbi:MAG: hypothetical protein ACKO96_08715, partial [Flammeovirgaceae bacterium]
DKYVTQSSEKVIRSKKVSFDKIDVEKSVGSFRPDLKCMINNRLIYIEVAVTHFIDKEKEKKIFKDGNPVLEIDLSKESRILTKEKLYKILGNGIDKMKWIYNPKIGERFLKRERIAREIKDFVYNNTRTLKAYGKNHDVYNCPIYKDHCDKIKIEDECYLCCCFVREMEGISHLGDEPTYQSRTIDCIGHVSQQYVDLLKSKGVKIRE